MTGSGQWENTDSLLGVYAGQQSKAEALSCSNSAAGCFLHRGCWLWTHTLRPDPKTLVSVYRIEGVDTLLQVVETLDLEAHHYSVEPLVPYHIIGWCLLVKSGLLVAIVRECSGVGTPAVGLVGDLQLSRAGGFSSVVDVRTCQTSLYSGPECVLPGSSLRKATSAAIQPQGLRQGVQFTWDERGPVAHPDKPAFVSSLVSPGLPHSSPCEACGGLKVNFWASEYSGVPGVLTVEAVKRPHLTECRFWHPCEGWAMDIRCDGPPVALTMSDPKYCSALLNRTTRHIDRRRAASHISVIREGSAAGDGLPLVSLPGLAGGWVSKLTGSLFSASTLGLVVGVLLLRR